ncbi:MAG: hypothetical protein HFJ95_04070 [Muribaculaceae bacterium]|nr:hypothetical protein [Muribaculaceae bacterium]
MQQYIFSFLIMVLMSSIHCTAQESQDVPTDNYGMVKTNIRVSYDYTNASISDHFNARMSYEFFKNQKFTLTANANYNSLQAELSADNLPAGYDPMQMGMNKTHLYGQLGVSASFRSRLFGRPFMAFGILSADWGDRRIILL